MERIRLQDTTLIGNWEEVQGVNASAITNNSADLDTLDGLIIKGYETKFGGTNENGERYTKDCIDEFIQRYFVGNGLNMPVDIQHKDDIDHLCGRVLYIESNSTGFYFVAYVPRSFKNYEVLKGLLKNGIIQGFSKQGWATDYEYKYKENGEYDYTLIKRMEIISMSLVAVPANGNAFEKTAEVVKDATRFQKIAEPQDDESGIDYMFN